MKLPEARRATSKRRSNFDMANQDRVMNLEELLIFQLTHRVFFGFDSNGSGRLAVYDEEGWPAGTITGEFPFGFTRDELLEKVKGLFES